MRWREKCKSVTVASGGSCTWTRCPCGEFIRVVCGESNHPHRIPLNVPHTACRLRQGGRIMGITGCGGSCVTEGGGERVTNTARGILLGGHTCKHLSALGTRGGRRCSCRVLEGSEEGGNESIGVGAVFLPEWESCCWQPGSVCSTTFCLL